MQHQRLGDLRADAAQRIERRHRLLEDHGDAIAAQLPHRLFGEADQLPPLEADRTGDPRAFGRQRHQRERGHRLAGAGFADHPEALALGKRKRRPIDDALRSLAASRHRRRARRPRAASQPRAFSFGSSASRRPSPSRLRPKHAERDRDARIEREPRRIVENVLGVGEHLAPRGLRRLRAEAEIGKRRLGEDGDRELNRRLNDQRRRDIGQHVIDGDGDRPAPRGAGGERIFARENAVGGGAGELGDDRHVIDADGDDGVDDAWAEGRSQHDRQEQRRKREDEVAELHDPVFDEALGERRDEAEDDAEHEPDADRDHADQNRDARARQDLRGDVASEIVGPEPMRRGRGRELVGNVDRGRRIGRPDERQARRRRSASRRARRRATGSSPPRGRNRADKVTRRRPSASDRSRRRRCRRRSSVRSRSPPAASPHSRPPMCRDWRSTAA